MKPLTKILANLVMVPMALGILSSPAHANYKSRYEQFMKHDDGDGVLYFNEYLVDFIDKSDEERRKAWNKFIEYDKHNKDFQIDKRDKILNGE